MFEITDPKQPFSVSNRVEIFPQDLEILIKLYQPLVGATGIALYQTLIQDFDPTAILSDSKGIYSLQEQIDCGLKDLSTSLHKLEGVGLVKTYLVENTVNQIVVFQLLKVPSAKEFFATPLLASLLKEKVGIGGFHDLSHYFAKKAKQNQKPFRNAKDVSASFLDVFRLPGDEAISPSMDVQNAAVENNIQDVAQAKINENDNVDWDFMKDQFEMYQISPKEVEQKKNQILGLMQIYGLNEQEFINETLPSLHGKNELDIREIERLIADNYRSDKTRQNIQSNLQKNKEPVKVPNNLSQDNQTLLKNANSLAPAEFLYRLKERKGGFATAAEKQILNNLGNQYGLPSDMINVLTYACLRYDSVLTSSLAYKIANDWLQHGVTNSVTALQYLEKRNQDAKRPKRYYSNTKPKRVEQGTDWSKKKAKIDNKVNSEDLKNFFKNLEDQSGMK